MLVEDIKQLIPVVQDTKYTVFGLDVETSGLDEHRDLLLLVQLSTVDEQYVINYGTADKRTLKYILELLEAREVTIVGHNIKFDLKFLYKNTGVLLTHVFDTFVAEILAYAGTGIIYPSLADLVKKYLHKEMEKGERESFYNKTDYVFTDDQIYYATLDVYVLIPLYLKLKEVLEHRKQTKILPIEMAFTPVLAMMEYTGIAFDVDSWRMLSKQAELEAEQALINLNTTLANRFNAYAGNYENALDVLQNIQFPVKTELRKAEREELTNITTLDEIKSRVIPMINFRSPKQAKHILTSLGANLETTNAKELIKFVDVVPAIKFIIEYREAKKKSSSFGEEFLKYVNPVTKCIHTNYNQLGAATGRLSSSDPNLQNIIADSRYRKPFISRDGYSFIISDYSNIELRIIGEASREPGFIDAFKAGLDLHINTASLVFGVPYDSVTREQRKLAKSLNFAVVYGTSAKGISYNFNIPENEGRELLQRYFRIYPKLHAFIKMFGEKCISLGYTITLGGRKRFLSYALSPASQKQYADLNKAIRQGINTLPQGTSADMIKYTLNLLHYNNPFGYENFRPILTVHDEVVVEVKDDIISDATVFLGDCMKTSGEKFLKLIPTEYGISVEKFWIKD